MQKGEVIFFGCWAYPDDSWFWYWSIRYCRLLHMLSSCVLYTFQWSPSSSLPSETERWWDMRSFSCCNSRTASISRSRLAVAWSSRSKTRWVNLWSSSSFSCCGQKTQRAISLIKKTTDDFIIITLFLRFLH